MVPWVRGLALAAALTAASRSQTAPPPSSPPETALSTLGVALDNAVRNRIGPAFAGAVLVARDGEILLRKGYGSSGIDGEPTTPKTLFDIASVSKSFTAAAILALEARGRLSVHDPLSRHFDSVPEDKAAIRIHDLLTHTSGLAFDVDFTDAELADRDAWLARVWREPLQFPAGERFAYNNTGYSVLAALVEIASRRPFESWLKKNVFVPAEMLDTGFLSDPTLDAARAAARRQSTTGESHDDTAIAWPWHWAFRGATGIVTTVDDLYRWDRTLYGDRVLDAGQREKMFKPFAGNYAYGWVATKTARDTDKLHHDGSTYGFRAVLARYPDEDAVVILTANRDAQLRELALDLERVLFDAPAPDERLAPCAGRYALPGGDELQVAIVGDRLVLRPLGPEAATRLQRGSASPGDDPFCRRSLADRAMRLLQPLVRGRHRQLRKSFGNATPDAALEDAVAEWRRLNREHGAFREARVIGSAKADRATYFRVAFGKTPTTWRAVWEDERQQFSSLQPIDRLFPFEAPSTWRHGHEFHLRSTDGFTDLRVVFEVENGGRATRLRWRDRSNPAGAELVCRRL